MIAEQRKRNQSSLLAQRRQLAQVAQMQKPVATEPSTSFQYPKLEGSLTPLEACFDVDLMKQQLVNANRQRPAKSSCEPRKIRFFNKSQERIRPETRHVDSKTR